MGNNLYGNKKIKYLINKMDILMKKNKITSDKWAQKIGEELLEQDLTPVERIDVLINLFKIAVKNEDKENAQGIVKEIMKYDILDNMNQSIKQKLRDEGVFSIYRDNSEEQGSKYSRSDLYNGNIKLEDLKEITDENSKTLQGCIFIAETCKYFELEQLGKKCLEGFKRNNPQLKSIEQKAISMALEALNNKKRKVTRGEDWKNIYQILEKNTEIEEYTH